jgi:hypothetical protein
VKENLNRFIHSIAPLWIVVWLLSTSVSHAQTTIVRGSVVDATTMEPVAFANVYFKSSIIGTTTSFEGKYVLETNEPKDSLTVSIIGYASVTKPIVKGREQALNFSLYPSTIGLNEVVVYPGENPAITLLKKVWEHRNHNNVDRLDAYSLETYTRTQMYLRPIIKRRSNKPNSRETVFDTYSMVAEEGAVPALPVYVNESSTEIHYLKTPKRERVVITATKTNSLADVESDIVTQLIQKSNRFNFYNNHVRILDKDFVSPLSTMGRFFYKYHLIDSLFIGDKYCYEVRVMPLRERDLAFNGTIWINDSTYALKRISVEVGDKANLNFVDRITIQQELIPTTTGAWIPYKTRVLSDAVNIFINAYTINQNFSTNRYPLSFYNTELQIADSAHKVSDETWKEIRGSSLDSMAIESIAKIDTLRNIPLVKVTTALVNMSIKGYLNLGKVEMGPYMLLYKNNEVEGHRFRMGFRTNSNFSEKWIAKGFLAYSTNIQEFFYNAQLERFLSRKSWTKVGVQYSEDVENLGALDEFYSNSAFNSFAASFGGGDKLNDIKIGRLWFETDLFRGFSQKIVLKNKTYKPLSPDYHFGYFSDESRTQIDSDITVSELNFTSIYQPKATFIVDKNERFPVSIIKAPTLTLNYSIGLKDFLGGDFSYHKASLGIVQTIPLASIGSFAYDLTLSKTYTSLPYPLLNMFNGNESIFRLSRTFNLMKYGEFIADESAELFCSFRQDGFILDKIPLIKKLKWRSVVTASVAYGGFDNSRNGIYHPEDNPDGILSATLPDGNALTTFKTLNSNTPYMEASYGIENIFQLFRIDAIHRLSYLKADANGNKPTPFAIKVSAVFRF